MSKKTASLSSGGIGWLLGAPFGPQICFNADSGAGTGGEGGQSSQEQATGPYRPDGLDEQYHGESDQETIDRLMSGLKDSKPVLPDDVSGYEFKADDGLKDYFADKDDPVLNSAKAAALSAGITPDQFQTFINETFKGPVGEGILAPPFDAKREFDALAGFLKTDAKGAEKAVKDAEAVASNLAKAMDLPDEAQEFFSAMAETASGVMLIQAYQKLASEKGIALGDGGSSNASHYSKDELRAMGADPRINPQSSKYDPAIRKKYDESFKALYPD